MIIINLLINVPPKLPSPVPSLIDITFVGLFHLFHHEAVSELFSHV